MSRPPEADGWTLTALLLSSVQKMGSHGGWPAFMDNREMMKVLLSYKSCVTSEVPVMVLGSCRGFQPDI
jgi:peptide methionine sulfoxide reductase MsrB